MTGPVDLRPDPWQRLLAIGSLLSVVVLALGLYVTNAANREQQNLTRQAQITDRFTKAVEQLGQAGPQKIDVRLGAVYSLERIMRDSPQEDQPAVTAILAAFIRTHAPQPSAALTSTSLPRGDRGVPRPAVDIQAAVAVLGRRAAEHDRAGDVLDFTNVNLAGADVHAAELGGAFLRNVDLFRADLSEADLRGADLRGADLRDADLSSASLEGADLRSADLSGAEMPAANLAGAKLRGADLMGVDLSAANLRGADLTGAVLLGADMREADLRDATLIDAFVAGADLRNADLQGTQLDGVGLEVTESNGYDFPLEDLGSRYDGYVGPPVRSIDFPAANLSTARNLTSEQLRCASPGVGVKLPAGVALPIRQVGVKDPACP